MSTHRLCCSLHDWPKWTSHLLPFHTFFNWFGLNWILIYLWRWIDLCKLESCWSNVHSVWTLPTQFDPNQMRIQSGYGIFDKNGNALRLYTRPYVQVITPIAKSWMPVPVNAYTRTRTTPIRTHRAKPVRTHRTTPIRKHRTTPIRTHCAAPCARTLLHPARARSKTVYVPVLHSCWTISHVSDSLLTLQRQRLGI